MPRQPYSARGFSCTAFLLHGQRATMVPQSRSEYPRFVARIMVYQIPKRVRKKMRSCDGLSPLRPFALFAKVTCPYYIEYDGIKQASRNGNRLKSIHRFLSISFQERCGGSSFGKSPENTLKENQLPAGQCQNLLQSTTHNFQLNLFPSRISSV